MGKERQKHKKWLQPLKPRADPLGPDPPSSPPPQSRQPPLPLARPRFESVDRGKVSLSLSFLLGLFTAKSNLEFTIYDTVDYANVFV
ncbi:hypothetical protein SLA2020_366880 [Shorea laevis]